MAEEFVEDETFAERFEALKEMFPEPVRNLAASAFSTSQWAASNTFTYGGKLLWVVASSAVILGLIPQFEADQEQMAVHQAESIRQQHQQMLTGGASSSGSGNRGAVPGMAPVPPRA